eukprot:350629-Pelagomonas_calceolata.AAC.1
MFCRCRRCLKGGTIPAHRQSCPACSACWWCNDVECFSTDAVLHAGSGECALYSQSGACQGLGVYVRDASLALRLLHCPNPPQPPLVSHTQHTLALLEQARGCEWLEHFMELCTSCMLKASTALQGKLIEQTTGECCTTEKAGRACYCWQGLQSAGRSAL